MTEVPAGSLTGAARALMLAGRWADALALLDAARPAGEAERSALAVAAADVAIEQDFFLTTEVAPRYLSAASAAVADGQRWYLDFLTLKQTYNDALRDLFAGGEPRPGAGDALADRIGVLLAAAPSVAERAWAAFYAGLIEDLLRRDEAAAAPFYRDARDLAEQAGDDLILSYALRHLGYLSLSAGDNDAAVAALRQSLALRQRYGCVPHVLAQYLALAELEGSGSAWARTVAGIVREWADAGLGTRWLAQSAAELATA